MSFSTHYSGIKHKQRTLGAKGHSLKACKIAAHSFTVNFRTVVLGSMNLVPGLSNKVAPPGATALLTCKERQDYQRMNGRLRQYNMTYARAFFIGLLPKMNAFRRTKSQASISSPLIGCSEGGSGRRVVAIMGCPAFLARKFVAPFLPGASLAGGYQCDSYGAKSDSGSRSDTVRRA